MQETYLTFVEGASSKFWKARVEGVTLTVQWGKIDTAGQSQEKTFGTDAEALAAFEKQKAEKVKKGYSEGEGSTVAASPAPRPAKPAESDTKPAAAPTPAPKSKEITEPRINLKPEDFARIGWKAPTPPEAPPPVKPFDKAECLDLIRAVCGDNKHGYWSWKWASVNSLRHGLSREEAHFWIAVFDAIPHTNTLESILKRLESEVYDGSISQDRAAYATGRWSEYGTLLARSLWTLYGAEGLAATLARMSDWYAIQAAESLERNLLFLLTVAQRSELSDAVAPHLTPVSAPTWALRLGAALGTNPDVLRGLVANMADGSAKPQHFNSYYSNHNLIAILGLGEPDLVASEIRRTHALPMTSDDIKALLAATEFRCLDLVGESIRSTTSKADAEKVTRALMLAEGPETAGVLADVYLNSKVPNLARDWWEKFPTFAIQGLAPLCAERGKLAEVAVDWLNSYKKREGAERIEAALQGLPDSIIQAVRDKVLDAAEEEMGEPLTDAEAPDWVKAVFGGELTVPDAPAEENPPHRLNVSSSDRPAPLPPLGQPLPVPPAAPFDFDACMAKLKAQFDGRYWRTNKLTLNFPMSLEEAHFWQEVLYRIGETHWNTTLQPQDLEKKLRTTTFGKGIDRKPLTKYSHPISLIPLWTLFGVDGLFALLRRQNNTKGFDRVLLPYLTEAQRTEIIQRITGLISEIQKNPYQMVGVLQLMEQLRVEESEIEKSLTRMKTDQGWGGFWNSQQFLPHILKFSNPDIVLSLVDQLQLVPCDEAMGRKWLAVVGWAGVPVLQKILNYGYYDKAEAAKIFALVESPAVAPFMAALRKFPSSKLVARGWLDRFPAFAIEGIAPLLVGTDKKEVTSATDYLRELKRKGYGWLIQKKLSGFTEPVQKELQSKVLDYDPRKERVATAKDAALTTLLPPVNVRIEAGLRYLSPAQMAMLVADLRTTPLSEPSPTLEMVRQNADKLSLERFAWALFESWIQEGAPSKDRWKLETLGHLGGDAIALKLTPLVRAWPGESQHQRAVLGLEVLRSIGTDTALMQINGIAQKVSFKGIKERAKECMDAIAADRGFSPEELSDRIIPDGGLDDRGSRVFDFGPRQFTFALGPDLKPALKDETGKRLPDLPKPNTKDDEHKATEAVATWKLLKKQVAEIAKTQAARLEQAMVLGRRWTPTEFQQLLIEHPVMGLLVQRLVWAAYDSSGKPLGSFRVADDLTLADTQDELWEIPDAATSIGIVHPSHLGPAEQSAWGEQLSDYDIIAPFVQLGRPTFALTDAEKKQSYLTRFAGSKVDPKVLIFGLDNLGWTRGTPQDGGGFCCHHKVFGDAVAVVVYEDGVWAGDNGDSWEPQEVTGVGFTSDKRQAEDGFFSFEYGETSRIPLTEIDPVVLSEVIYDVTRLVEKGKKA